MTAREQDQRWFSWEIVRILASSVAMAMRIVTLGRAPAPQADGTRVVTSVPRGVRILMLWYLCLVVALPAGVFVSVVVYVLSQFAQHPHNVLGAICGVLLAAFAAMVVMRVGAWWYALTGPFVCRLLRVPHTTVANQRQDALKQTFD